MHSSSRCRSNQKTTAFSVPSAIVSSLSMVSLGPALRAPWKKSSITLAGLVRRLWGKLSRRMAVLSGSHLHQQINKSGTHSQPGVGSVHGAVGADMQP